MSLTWPSARAAAFEVELYFHNFDTPHLGFPQMKVPNEFLAQFRYSNYLELKNVKPRVSFSRGTHFNLHFERPLAIRLIDQNNDVEWPTPLLFQLPVLYPKTMAATLARIVSLRENEVVSFHPIESGATLYKFAKIRIRISAGYLLRSRQAEVPEFSFYYREVSPDGKVSDHLELINLPIVESREFSGPFEPEPPPPSATIIPFPIKKTRCEQRLTHNR